MSIDHDDMPASDRLKELAELLVAGLTRHRGPKSSGFFRTRGESSLHCSPDQSSHEPVLEKAEGV